MNPLRILVFSASFGAGHIKAAEGLIQALQIREPGALIIHEDFMRLHSRALNSMLKNLYINVIKQAPELYGTFYRKTENLTYNSHFQRFINNVGRRQITEYIGSHKPDLIICTYPTVSGLLAQQRMTDELSVPLVTVVTDYSVHCQWIHPGVDLYLVGNRQVRNGLIKRGISPQAIEVTGIPVSPKFDRRSDSKEVLEKIGLDQDRLTFLIMGGAYGVLDHARQLCQLLAMDDAPVQIIFVCGKDKKLYRSLDLIMETARNRIVRFPYVNNMDELMSAADVIVTKAGGLTVSESLAKHLPLIIFKPIPGQEENNAHYIKEIGAGKIAHTLQEFEDIFHELLDSADKIWQMRQAAAKEHPGNPAGRAADSILKLARERRLLQASHANQSSSQREENLLDRYS